MKKVYTAWELGADWWWVNHYEAIKVGGRTKYETATCTKGGTGKLVGIRRLDGLRTVVVYFEPDTKFTLRKIPDYQLY